MATRSKKPRGFTAEARRREPGIRLRGALSGLLRPGDIAHDVFGEELPYGELMAYCFRRFGPPNAGSDDYKDLCCWHITTPMPGLYLIVRIIGLSDPRLMFGYLATHEIEAELGHEELRARLRHRRSIVQWVRRHFRGEPDVVAGAEKWNEPAPKGETWEQMFKRTTANEKVTKPLMAKVWTARAEAGFEGRFNERGPTRDRANEAIRTALKDLLRPVWIRDVAINCRGRVSESAGRRRSVEHFKAAGNSIPLDLWDDTKALYDLFGLVSLHGGGAVGLRAVVDKLGGTAAMDKAHAAMEFLENRTNNTHQPWWRGMWTGMHDGEPVVFVRVAHNAPKHLGERDAVEGVTCIIQREPRGRR